MASLISQAIGSRHLIGENLSMQARWYPSMGAALKSVGQVAVCEMNDQLV